MFFNLFGHKNKHSAFHRKHFASGKTVRHTFFTKPPIPHSLFHAPTSLLNGAETLCEENGKGLSPRTRGEIRLSPVKTRGEVRCQL